MLAIHHPHLRSIAAALTAFLVTAASPLSAAVASLPLPTDGDSYTIDGWKRNLAVVVPANLDGDGVLDFVSKSDLSDHETMMIEARTLDGKFLWEYDTRITFEMTQDMNGAHEPVVPWDLDGDGIDEVITIWLDRSSETIVPYVIALDGKTGAEKGKIKLPPGGGMSGGFAPGRRERPDGLGNHYCCIAYLDGPDGRPYACISQGIYKNGAVWAFYWDPETKNLAHHWTYQHKSYEPLQVYDANGKWLGIGWGYQGTSAHDLKSYDLDGDGKEEVIFGGTIVKPDGTKLWSLFDLYGYGHVDVATPGDLLPDRPGSEIFFCVEWGGKRVKRPDGTQYIPGSALMVRAEDGSVIWEYKATHMHSGWACNVSDEFPGEECRAREHSERTIDATFTADGKKTGLELGVHRPPEWTGDDVYDVEQAALLISNSSYAADLGGGDMHGAEELVILARHSKSVQIKFNKEAKPYRSRWANRHYRQDVVAAGAGYTPLRTTFRVQETGTASGR